MRRIFIYIMSIYMIFLLRDIWVNFVARPWQYGAVACILALLLMLSYRPGNTKKIYFLNRIFCLVLISLLCGLAGPLYISWYIILASDAVLTIRDRSHLVLVGLSFAGYAVYLVLIREWTWPPSVGDLSQVGLESLGFIVIILLIYNQRYTILQRQRTEELYTELQQSHQRLEQYAQQVEALGALQERSRIAREIHDSLGHSLTAIIMQLEAGKLNLETDLGAARTRVSRAEELAREAMLNLREAVRVVRWEHFEELESGIRTLASSLGLGEKSLEMDIQGQRSLLSQPIQVCNYRLVQEALTNSIKHGEARNVSVQICCAPNKIRLIVSDDGKGASQPSKGFGLRGMEERLAELGGTMRFITAPGQGFCLEAELSGREEANA